MKKINIALILILISIAHNANSKEMKFNLHMLNDNDPLLSRFNPTSINDKGQVVSFASIYDFNHNTFTNVWDMDPVISNFNPIEINNNGDMAGILFDGGIPSAASYIDGKLNIYGEFGQASVSEGLNNIGTVLTDIPGKEVIYKDGVSINLKSLPDGGNGAAFAINDKSYSAGSGLNNKFESEAASWDQNGNITVLPTLNLSSLGTRANNSQAFDINNNNQIVGQSRGEAVMWRDGSILALSNLDNINIESSANAINDLGWIVGSYGSTGFVWNDGSMMDLNDHVIGLPAGWHIRTAVDINNNGFIIGNMSNNETSESLGYILSPIPEPSTYAMLLAGLGVMGFVGMRRKIG